MARGIESWRLFWLLALVTSLAICSGLPGADFHSVHGIGLMVLRAVRCALPWFLLAFTASSLAALWPNRFTRWLLANRRYFGLAFAFGMAWHFSFVGYSIYWFGWSASGLNATAIVLDFTALTFLLLMTLTSFRVFARHLTRTNWRRLHKTGVYVIWFVASYFYLGSVRHGTDALHYVAFGLLIAAWLLRVAAWTERRARIAAVPAAAAISGSPRRSR